ncbi:MAG: mannonate dehydratase [Terriglobia bacterium]
MATDRPSRAIAESNKVGCVDPGRRKFAKLALTGALGGPGVLARSLRPAALNPEFSPGVKICAQLSGDSPDEDYEFVRQMGVEYVSIWTRGSQATLENFRRLKEKTEGFGIKVWNIGNVNVHNMPEVTLNLPGRDDKLEEYKSYLRHLGKLGIHYTTYAHMGNGIWSSENESTRGGASARAYDAAKNPKGYWDGKVFTGPLSHGRRYTKEEIWANYTYFIKAVAPVAEQEGVRIGIHPDDPPAPELAGVPRCIFGNFDGYMRALEIAASPNVGVCLCCGTWLEGGPLMGRSVVDAIHHFARQRKLFKIHFRNVNASLPHFVETFVDDGSMDMYQVMKALVEVRFDGIAIPDHVPQMAGGYKAGYAYTVGYMKALLGRAQSEVGTS